jgi:hypothetical protein
MKDDPKIPEHGKRNFVEEIERTGKDLKELRFGFCNANYSMLVGTRYEHDLTKFDNQGHLFKTILGATYMISRATFIIRWNQIFNYRLKSFWKLYSVL